MSATASGIINSFHRFQRRLVRVDALRGKVLRISDFVKNIAHVIRDVKQSEARFYFRLT